VEQLPDAFAIEACWTTSGLQQRVRRMPFVI
jgi:hypothetical protein